MTKLQVAILQTLAYADIFDYPLRENEIYRFLISSVKVSKCQSVSRALKRLPQISQKNGFYFFKGREEIVAIRKKRERWSQKKMEIARRVANWLRFIPTIKMVAVTGALAMNNSQKEDDIDLLIVTTKNRLWLTRLLTVFLAELVARRRRPGDSEVRDKICLNMFLDENHLAVPKKEQDLFSAHEVCQLKPLWEKDETYQRFLRSNQWVERYLPNWKENTSEANTPIPDRAKAYAKNDPGLKDTSDGDPKGLLRGGAMDKLEILAMRLQLVYMARRKTTETTEPGRIRFHPEDARKWILKKYQKRLQKLHLA